MALCCTLCVQSPQVEEVSGYEAEKQNFISEQIERHFSHNLTLSHPSTAFVSQLFECSFLLQGNIVEDHMAAPTSCLNTTVHSVPFSHPLPSLSINSSVRPYSQL